MKTFVVYTHEWPKQSETHMTLCDYVTGFLEEQLGKFDPYEGTSSHFSGDGLFDRLETEFHHQTEALNLKGEIGYLGRSQNARCVIWDTQREIETNDVKHCYYDLIIGFEDEHDALIFKLSHNGKV